MALDVAREIVNLSSVDTCAFMYGLSQDIAYSEDNDGERTCRRVARKSSTHFVLECLDYFDYSEGDDSWSFPHNGAWTEILHFRSASSAIHCLPKGHFDLIIKKGSNYERVQSFTSRDVASAVFSDISV